MRILLSALNGSASAAHGGPVITRRHAGALARRGFEVCLVAPRGDAVHTDAFFSVDTYKTAGSATMFSAQRPDPAGSAAFADVMRRFKPDVVYDVHGPACAVDASVRAGVPVVAMVGAYTWYCLQSFLVDSQLRRCSGPDSVEKCYDCLNRNHAIHTRLAHAALKPAARLGYVPVRLWDAVVESHRHMAKLRDSVTRYVVGDRQAHEFFLAHGIPEEKLVRIPVGLPTEALRSRRVLDSGVPVRDRPLRIGFVGRPHLEKGIHVLARAFDSLPRELPVELWIVHSQLATPNDLRPHFPDSRRFAADLESRRVRLIRPAAQSNVFDVMAQIDVGIVPSIAYESPSLAMLEFAAQGTPIVRSESRGMDHVIQDGVNGRTFPYGDAQALASIIREIAADPSVLARWRSKLPTIQSDDQYARRLGELFESLCGRKDPSVKEVAMV